MQNIYITRYQETPIDIPSVAGVCFNELQSKFYAADKQNTIYQLSYSQSTQYVKLMETIPADPELAGKTIIQMTFLVDLQCLCVITKEGSIFKVSAQETQLVAQNEDGIEAASWSPSQDRLLVITKNNTLLQLNEEFNLENELPLNDRAEEGVPAGAKISWKPDGKFSVINFGIKGTEARKCLIRDNLLNVFKSPAKPDTDPKGLVQSLCQAPVPGLKSPVAWNPTGNIIAGVEFSEGKKKVVFCQKNGLRHLDFPLEEWVKEVKALNYSPDAEILYVQVMTSQSRQLLLYHRANYHWYLKTSIQLHESDRYIPFKQRRNCLFVIGDGHFQSFEFTIMPNKWMWKSYSEEKNDPACVFYSVDSDRLLISDFSKSIIPPPMCLKELETDSRILATAKDGNYILIITARSIYLYEHSTFNLSLLCQNTIKQRLCSVCVTSVSPPTFLIGSTEYSITQKKLEARLLVETQPYSSITFLKLNDERIEVSQVNSQLFVNDALLSQETTSYCLYDVFLLFTVSTSELYQKLYVFNLEIDSQIYLDTSPTLLKKLEPNSLNMRNVERGSRIIGCSQGRCIFQLPRGNLEGIHPKIITLLNVKRSVSELNYLRAFQLIRTHKLDMNLLFDLDPDQFLTNSQKILKDIKKVDYISLVIASLKEGVSDELKYCLSKEEVQKIEDYFQINKNKVNTVCELISKGLRSIGYEQYILAIVAAEVKRGELARVLQEIKAIKAQDVVVKVLPHLTEEPKKKKPLNSKEILEYVCWMADPEIVYKAAFLTYDLELVAMAAEFTQKDPKEYLPYLQQLKSIPDETDRKARICLDLKEYSEAIKQLSTGSPFQKEQALQLVKDYSRFKVGIQYFKEQKEHLLKVKTLLAEYLQSREEFNEALNIYITCGLWEKALGLSTKLSDTKNVLELMRFLKEPEENIESRMKQIVGRLVEHPGNGESLGLAYEYLRQYQQAAKVYMKAESFANLNRILKYLPEQFILSELVQSLKFLHSLKYNQTLQQIKTFTQKYVRLQAVQKLKKLTGTLVIATKQADQMYSQYSRASEQSRSNYTVSTTTGMKKKKQKVKGILNRNVKEGSPLEEEYLVAVLNDLSTKALDTIKTNKVLIQQLIYMNLLTLAQSLRNQTRSYAEIITKRVRLYKEIKYEQQNPDVLTVYPAYAPKPIDLVSSFDYIL